MYKNKKHINLKTLKDELEGPDLFKCKTSVWKFLKKIGFTYRKGDPHRGLMELLSIASKRLYFSHDYMKLKEEGSRQFVFLDGTWVSKDGTIGRSWQDSNVKSVEKTKVGGARYIVPHAGCSIGFICRAYLFFCSKTKKYDYHEEMNQNNCHHWFEYQPVTNSEEPSIIVMDDASYHSTVIDKAPTTASKKADIPERLSNNNILFEDTFLKPQLLDLVAKYM